MKRRLGMLLLTLLAALTLSGCGETQLRLDLNPQELYALPELPAQYTTLNALISEILSTGAEYAAPTTGTRVQNVQMVDLDRDGSDEAVAFFRNAGDEKPLKIHVFKSVEGVFHPAAVIEGSGTAISSVNYTDLNSDGRTEIVVGWKVNTELQALSVYALRKGTAEEPLRPEEVLKSVQYVKYAITDLDRDQLQEVMILRSDEEGMGIAEYYTWGQTGNMARSATSVSMTMADLSRQGRLTEGILSDGTSALFVTGVNDENHAITDVLTLREGELNNILLSNITGMTRCIAEFYGLYSTDMNGDGTTEVPIPAPLPGWGEDDTPDYRIDWLSIAPDGSAETTLRTYHDMENRWYFRLPESWTDHIMLSRSTISDEAAVTFFRIGEGEEKTLPVLRISAITGPNRDIKALRGARFILSRQLETTYTAELLEGNENWEYALTTDEVRSLFSIIAAEWTAGN